MPSKTVQSILDIPAEQYAYLKMLAEEEGLTLEEFVLQCLPHPEGMVSDLQSSKKHGL